jgi:phage replication-related protein YjqB (UPF0714/DUF867 family)
MGEAPTLTALLDCAGVVEHCELRSARVGFLSLHGGLEATTFEIASEAARRSGASLYAVVQPDELRWHVPSQCFDAGASPQLDAFCAHVTTAISLHGYGGLLDSDERWTTVVLGGHDRVAAVALAALLRTALPDYRFVDDLDAIPPQYRGVHAANPVNRTRAGGVQLELPPRIRGNSPIWTDTPRNEHNFVPVTETLVATLAQYARSLEHAR